MESFSDTLANSGPIGLIVMIILIIFSLASWTIIFAKFHSLKGILSKNKQFIDEFWHTKDLMSLYENKGQDCGPSHEIFVAGVTEFERQKQKGKKKEDVLLVIERALARAGRFEVKKVESHLPFLATIGSVSPFIGLFGTVVGIMSSFEQIGILGNANLSTVAPGISEALLATALGLFAAIPAVMAYNMFQTKLQVLRGDLNHFCQDLIAVLRSHIP